MKLEKIEEIKTLLDEISKAAIVELKKFDASSYEIPTFIFCSLLDRAAINLLTIRILIERLEKQPSMEGPIGILLRSNLLDYMIGIYMRSAIKKGLNLRDGKDYLNEAIQPIVADQIKYALLYLKMSKNSGNCSDEVFRNGVEKLHESYRVLFKQGEINYLEPEKMLKQPSSISATELFKKISASEDKQYTSGLYDLYQLYSKYDHFGLLTNHLQSRGTIVKYKTILEAIKYVAQGMSHYAELLQAETTVEIDPTEIKRLAMKFTQIQL